MDSNPQDLHIPSTRDILERGYIVNLSLSKFVLSNQVSGVTNSNEILNPLALIATMNTWIFLSYIFVACCVECFYVFLYANRASIPTTHPSNKTPNCGPTFILVRFHLHLKAPTQNCKASNILEPIASILK